MLRTDERRTYRIKGVVQGVGFRPFVYRAAVSHGLSGWVLNDSDGVVTEVSGEPGAIEAFIREVKEEAPVLATVNEVILLDASHADGENGGPFRILESESLEGRETLISPDTHVCPDCLRELFDPEDRRHRYPFINCTNCGPRYSIVKDIPYDRKYTTMSAFPMCPICQTEYEDVLDRRFHAQPNACWSCGPRAILLDREGREVEGEDPVGRAAELLKQGAVVAVKGLGGYHLVADPGNGEAVRTLRSRKKRDDKPFALLAETVEQVRRFAHVSEAEERVLLSKERPIVLLEKRGNASIHPDVAPLTRTYGVMLAYTPLHYLLLRDRFEALIATSGNVSDEPIVYRDEEALTRLSDIADYFLAHNRDIHIRVDDSIVRLVPDGAGRDAVYPIRRARGYAPLPVEFPRELPSVLALGAELKNTVCLSKGRKFFVSQHIGDLKNLEIFQSFVGMTEHFKSINQIEPRAIACDAHPDFFSTGYADSQRHLPVVRVQHHHAHMASCMAEHGLDEPVIGVIFDGTGYGSDGKIWGGEFLTGDYSGFRRRAHLAYFPLPGGDKAVKEPYRVAIGFLANSLEGELKGLPLPPLDGLDDFKLNVLVRMVQGGVNSPLTSSMGRLFDAVSSLIGVRQTIRYEGQAAIELEQLIDESDGKEDTLPYELADREGALTIDVRPLFRELTGLLLQGGHSKGSLSARFHRTIVRIVEDVCLRIREETGLNTVVLSGGVFLNVYLLLHCTRVLENNGFEVRRHAKVPTNDGGISLGQAVIAGFRIKSAARDEYTGEVRP